MGQINSKKGIRIQDSEEETTSYCSCLEYGIYSILTQRFYLTGENKARDDCLWEQCHNCGLVVPIYEAKKESKPRDFVETSENPFSQGKTIVGLGNKKSKDRYQNE